MISTLLPQSFEVGGVINAEIVVELPRPLKQGECIDLYLPHVWTAEVSQSYVKAFQREDPDGRDFVSVEPLGSREVGLNLTIEPCHRSGDSAVQTRHGRRFRVALERGELPAGDQVRFRIMNTTAPLLAVREVPHVVVAGEEVPESAFTGWEPVAKPAVYFRLIAPSAARPGESFTVRLVSLDEYWNVSSSRFEGLSVAVKGGAVLAEGINFTGATAAEVSLPETGTFRLEAEGPASKLVARAPHLPQMVYSGPIRVAKGAKGPFWGDVHCHTGLSSDGLGTDPYTYARLASGIDFAAVTEHSDSITHKDWETLRAWAKDATMPDEFAALLALEIYHYNVYFRDHEAPLGELNRNRLSHGEAAQALAAYEVQTGPHHTGINFGRYRGSGFLFNEMPDDILSLVEVYSSHGQSERYDPMHALAYEFNRNREPESRFNHSAAGPHYARDAWAAGKRLAAIASSDDHFAQPGKPYRGCTAVFADRIEPGAIWDAIRARSCYATTGERVLLDFRLGEKGTGEVQEARAGERLTGLLQVWGTSPVVLCEVYRCLLDGRGVWETIAAYRGDEMDVELGFQEVVTHDAVYYACVMEQALVAGRPVMAWTSPIWVVCR